MGVTREESPTYLPMNHITIVEVTWLLIPAALANMAPVFAARYNWLPALNIPIDNGLIWHDTRLLGDKKTIRGFIIAGLAAALVGLFRGAILQSTIIGLSALLGDAAFSFFKRRLGIPPGSSWVPFDQIDFVIGALIATWFFIPLSLSHIIYALIIFGLGSYFVSTVGVILGIKESL